MSQISDYQKARMLISLPTDLETFLKSISDLKLSKNNKVGITREWRAYWYLRARFPKWHFEMSSSKEDSNGIDVVGHKSWEDQKGHDAWVTYQVGGPALIDEKLRKAMKYLQVTEKKVYLRNGKSIPLPLSEM